MGDTNYTTNNEILLKAFKALPAIICVQQTSNKEKITKKVIEKSNWLSMGIAVGSITNKVTSMFNVLANLSDEESIKEINYRIMCGQLYQQSNLDSAKGCLYKPMPKHWHDYKKCETEFDKQLCAHKKPYFMLYRYGDIKRDYNNYISKNNINSIKRFGKELSELISQGSSNQEEQQFLENYYKHIPVSITPSTMNRICWHIENEIKEFNVSLKAKDLSYDKYKKSMRIKDDERKLVISVSDEYSRMVTKYKIDGGQNKNNKHILIKEFKTKLIDNIEMDKIINILIEQVGRNKKYKTILWDLFGYEFVERIGEINVNS